MVTVTFARDGRVLARIEVRAGRPPRTEGECDWLDLSFEPYSARLQKLVSYVEDPEEWARSLPGAYADSGLDVSAVERASAQRPQAPHVARRRTPPARFSAAAVVRAHPRLLAAALALLAAIAAGLLFRGSASAPTAKRSAASGSALGAAPAPGAQTAPARAHSHPFGSAGASGIRVNQGGVINIEPGPNGIALAGHPDPSGGVDPQGAQDGSSPGQNPALAAGRVSADAAATDTQMIAVFKALKASLASGQTRFDTGQALVNDILQADSQLQGLVSTQSDPGPGRAQLGIIYLGQSTPTRYLAVAYTLSEQRATYSATLTGAPTFTVH